GILIERHGVNPDAAFNVLRTASQRQNRRIRDIAEEIVRTAQTPGGPDSIQADREPSSPGPASPEADS
ncbi:MAG: ANTAR domain-containing protein, partial [Actinomycetota bacterium]|nr:ANTAR domain-containing protein [Actinomycetota bacterium]